MSEHYKRILRDILDTLEGGDVALDFEDMPSAATTLRIIADIAGNALRGVEAIEKLMDALDSRVSAIKESRENAEVSK